MTATPYGSEQDVATPLTDPVQAGASHRAMIEDLAARKLQAFRGTIDENGDYLSNVYTQNRSLAAHITADYYGRFLIELIQNGTDIQPRGSADGEIAILLDADEGGHGTLYVANRGAPFAHENVDALCDIGMSSKPPGEAIGNKGLGFRSVHHVTDVPEIYSQASAVSSKPYFDGFCFSYARSQELDAMLPEPKVRRLAEVDLPVFHVPRWLVDQPERVRDFARRGFATVIRLPLRDAMALESAREEIARLAASSAPLLLFLDRLARLSARIETDGTAAPITIELVRCERQIRAQGLALSTVDLGAAGTYLLARRAIREAEMLIEIEKGVASRQLHPSWTKWSGDGEVALAVRMDEGTIVPRLFTFLPMGRSAAAPFRGHLHGTFFPTSNRKAIDPEIALNRMLLLHAAALAADAVQGLSASEEWVVEADGRALLAEVKARAAVDLLAWKPVDSLEPQETEGSAAASTNALDLPSTVAAEIAARCSVDTLAKARVVPCLGAAEVSARGEPGVGSVIWMPAGNAFMPRDNLEAFSVEMLAAHGEAVDIAPFWPGLGERRTEDLIDFLKTYADIADVEPTSDECAAIAESVAASLPKRGRDLVPRWTAYYRDLEEFMQRKAVPLAGRAILLCDDGELRRTLGAKDGDSSDGKPRRRRGAVPAISVFFPPARRGTADADEDMQERLSPPKPLREHFAFLSDDLPWFGELAEARKFLEGELVNAFDSETVFTRIARLVEVRTARETRIAGLRWAFGIWCRARSVGRPVSMRRQYRLFVPTLDGTFVASTRAVFSAGWPKATLGHALQEFLNIAPPDSEDLAALRRRRLAPPAHRAFRASRIADWTLFLEELGVKQGLHPEDRKPDRPIPAYQISSISFCDGPGASTEARELWRRDVEEHVPEGTALRQTTNYVVVGPMWWMPGQGEHQRFSSDCREAFATLLIEWLQRAKDVVLDMEIHHQHFKHADNCRWPTPLGAFLRSADWIPVDEPTPNGVERRHMPPRDVWISTSSGERFPPFLRHPAISFGRALQRDPDTISKRLTDWGHLQILNAPETLGSQINFLTDQFASGGVSRNFERELVNLYNHTWQHIADEAHDGADVFREASPPETLIARRGSGFAAVSLADDEVVVRDSEDEVVLLLAVELGYAVLDVRTANSERIGRAFHKIYGDRIKLASKIDYEIRLDKTPLSEVVCETTATAFCPWLRPMLAVALEALRGAELMQLPHNRSTELAKLEQVGLYVADRISFRMDGQVVQPQSARVSHRFRDASGKPFVAALRAQETSWRTVEDRLPAICEAIERPGLLPNMRLLARELETLDHEVVEDTAGGLDFLPLCRALHLDNHATQAARETLARQLDRHLPWLRAVVHLAGGTAALAAFDADEGEDTPEMGGLLGRLQRVLEGSHFGANAVLDACRSCFTLEQMRETLKLKFAAFNESLAAVGAEQDLRPERHAAQLENYVADHEIDIIDALRGMAAPALERFQPVPEYRQLRDSLRDLGPKAEWLPLHFNLPEELLSARVADWLSDAGAPARGSGSRELPPLNETRKANSAALRAFATIAAPLQRSWCAERERLAPEIWRAGEAAIEGLRRAFDEAGAFDFQPMDDEAMLAWCGALELWPEGMPATLDRETLGISETDLEAAERKAQQERERREAQARSLDFNGRRIDPREADWDAISDEIAAALPRRTRSMALGTFAVLAPAGTKGRRSGAAAGKGGARMPGRLPQEKADMIGRVGEIIVYHWLCGRFPQQDIDKAWVSSIGEAHTGRPGYDGLGYDFRVVYRNQTWLIEVKASSGDPQRFEMGETEVRAARETARPRSKERYVIAYVGNVETPSEARIEILPNPLSSEADGVLELIGEGIRYRFRRP